jgi:hypothetical protein
VRRLLNALLYFPARDIIATPAAFRDLAIGDARLHGW